MSAAVTTVNGVTADSNMTPLQIFNAHLTAAGAPAYDPRANAPNLAGPAGHPYVLADSEATARAMTAPPPTTVSRTPSPQELEASRSAKLEAFDSEMRQAGLQKPLQQPPAQHQVRDSQGRFMGNTPAIEAVNAWYRALPADQRGGKLAEYESRLAAAMSDGDTHSDPESQPGPAMSGETALATLDAEFRVMSPAEQEANREDYLSVRQDVANGATLRRLADGTLEAEVSHPAAGAVPTYAQDDSWQQHVVDGQIDVSKLTLAHTANYRIPVFVKDQTLTVAAIDQLRQARAAGFTQQQVDSYFRQEAIKLGWIRS